MQTAKPLLEKIESANRRHKLFSKNDSVLLAVSGGPDSVALLYLVNLLRKKYSFKLAAAHVNHGLNKRAAARYEICVRRHCRQLAVPLHETKVDLRKMARLHKRSIEEMGRLVRYDFFEKTAKKCRARKILTAHTMDDQAETILMRLVRGSGLRGVSGIPARRVQGKFTLVRPLLSLEKHELTAFLRQNHIPYCVDKSNNELEFTRNRVRHELLPALRAYNPQIKSVLCSFADVCREAQEDLEQAAGAAFKKCAVRSKRGKTSLHVQKLQKLSPAVLRETLVLAVLRAKGDLKRISNSHVEAVARLAHSGEGRLDVSLPGLKVSRRGTKLVFGLVDSRIK